MQQFVPWSPSHFLVIATTLAAAAGLSLARREQRGRPGALLFDRVFAVVASVIWIATQITPIVRGDASLRLSLPLHISDLTTLAVPVAIATRAAWPRAIVYYWGLALGSLAFLMPDLRDGPGTVGFWLFWLAHGMIFVAIAWDLAGRDYRPRWPDLRRAVIATVVYSSVILAFDAATGFGYGYLGPDQPDQPPILHRFGPWPWRAIPMTAVALLVMVFLTLPWARRGRTQSL